MQQPQPFKATIIMTATSSTPLDLNTVLSLIEELKAKGNIHFKARDYHHAITEYDRVIQEYTDIRSQDPNPIEKWMKENKNSCSKLTAMIGATFNNRAFCYFRLEMFTAAEDDATQAIKHKFWKVKHPHPHPSIHIYSYKPLLTHVLTVFLLHFKILCIYKNKGLLQTRMLKRSTWRMEQSSQRLL